MSVGGVVGIMREPTSKLGLRCLAVFDWLIISDYFNIFVSLIPLILDRLLPTTLLDILMGSVVTLDAILRAQGWRLLSEIHVVNFYTGTNILGGHACVGCFNILEHDHLVLL